MPLSPPEPRKLRHVRHIECHGYRREDGLWDIEGHLTDIKTYPFDNAYRGLIEPGVPAHDMWIRLTVDAELTIRTAEASTEAGPYEICPAAALPMAELTGMMIGPGWRRAVQKRVGGTKGCTHLVEMLQPLATVAFQTVYADLKAWRSKTPSTKPPQLGSCYALRTDGEVVKDQYPEWYTGDKG